MAKRMSMVLHSPQSQLYHACEHITRKSRADSCTHCLHARWIMGGAGVGEVLCVDGAIKITLISLCLHSVPHQNLNREVRHSLTWHSSKSESALERFEPVAMVQQLPDGRGSVFARVAARRQKVFKRGIDTYAKHVCRRRRDGSQSIPLFVLFVLFGQAKRTLKEKKHKETFLFWYFSVKKSTKSHLRGLSSLLKNTFRVHELVARAMRGKCVRQMGKGKIGSFTAPHNFCYTTRANISHEEAEQIRARIVCTPAEKEWRAWI